MIEAEVTRSASGFVARLTARATALAEARAAAMLLARRGGGERRWRSARLLWPLFAPSRKFGD